MIRRIKETCAALVAILVLGGCSSWPRMDESVVLAESGWLSSQGMPIPLAANELELSSCVEISGDELPKVFELLKNSEVVELGRDIGLFPSARSRLAGQRLFLLRAERDDIDGSYSSLSGRRSGIDPVPPSRWLR